MDTVFWVTYAALWLVVATMAFAFIELLRQTAQLREAMNVYEGPKEQLQITHVGERLPASDARHALTGDPVRWEDHLGRDMTVLVVLHPGCVTCQSVAEGLPKVMAGHDGATRVVPIAEGRNLEAAKAFLDELGLDPARAIIDAEPTLSRSLNLITKPAAIVLLGDEVSTAATIKSASQVELLVRDSEVRLRARGRTTGSDLALAVGDSAHAD